MNYLKFRIIFGFDMQSVVAFERRDDLIDLGNSLELFQGVVEGLAISFHKVQTRGEGREFLTNLIF